MMHHNETHGHTTGSKQTKEYISWCRMRSRCKYKKNDHYHLYGGRGITVCQRWDSFLNFLKDMGTKPSPEYSIDRVDNNKNYEPSNCRWASPAEQQKNKRTVRRVTISGETKTVPEWCAIYGINRHSVDARVHRGWDIVDAIIKPVDIRRRKKAYRKEMGGHNA